MTINELAEKHAEKLAHDPMFQDIIDDFAEFDGTWIEYNAREEIEQFVIDRSGIMSDVVSILEEYLIESKRQSTDSEAAHDLMQSRR